MRTAFALKWSVLLALAAPALAQSQSVVATEVTSATDVVVSDAPVDSSTDTGAGSTPTVANLTPTASPATETGSAGGMNGTTGGTNGTAGGLGSSLNLSARCLAAVEKALSADSATGQCLHTTILWASASSNSTASNSTASNSTVPDSTAANSTASNSTASNSTASPFVSKVEEYLNATCMSAPCTNATISNATSILIQECSEDLTTWNISVDTVNKYAQLYPLVREVACLKTSDPFTAAGNSSSSNTTTTPPVMTSTALATPVGTPVVASTGEASNQTVAVNRRQATDTANSGPATVAGNASVPTGAASAIPATTSVSGSDNSTTVGTSEYCLISIIDEIQALLGTEGLSLANLTQLLIPGSLMRNSTASTSEGNPSSDNSTTPVVGNSTASLAPMASATPATSSNTTSANSTSATSTSSTSPPKPTTLLPLIMEVLCNDCIYAAADLVSQSASWLIETGISGNITVLDYLKARCGAEGYIPTTNGTLPQTISPSAQNSTYGFPITFFDPMTGNWTTTTPQTNSTDINAVNGTATASLNGTATATGVVSGTDASTPAVTTPVVSTETAAVVSTQVAGATDTVAVDPTATESATAGASLGVRSRKVYRGPGRTKA